MRRLCYSPKSPSSRQTAQGMAQVLAKPANTEIGDFGRNPFRARAILFPERPRPGARQRGAGDGRWCPGSTVVERGHYASLLRQALRSRDPGHVVIRSCGISASLRGAEEGPHTCGDLTPGAANTRIAKAMSRPPAVASDIQEVLVSRSTGRTRATPLHGTPALRLGRVHHSSRRVRKQNSHERNQLMACSGVPV
jgi:hypothetical protein